jgi:hypothetical protein
LEESEKEKREDGKMLERVLKGCLMVDAKNDEDDGHDGAMSVRGNKGSKRRNR